MNVVQDKAIKNTLRFWSTELDHAEYVSDGETFEVPLTRCEVDEEQNALVVEFNINDDIESDVTVTMVRWIDSNGDVWAESEENMVRNFYTIGIFYRLVVYLREE